MILPIRRKVVLPYGDVRILRFQVLKNGEPYSLENKDLYFGIMSRYGNYPKVELNMREEGWIEDEIKGIFKVVLDTLRFQMLAGFYEIEVELREENKIISLIHYDVETLKDVLH